MTSGSGYREELRGKLRAAFSEQKDAKGVASSRSSKVVEQARRVFDRGAALEKKATSSYEKFRPKWVLAEYKKLQLKSWLQAPAFRPAWARSANLTMQQAERLVECRYSNRLTKIDTITRRAIARVNREHSHSRSRGR